MFCEIQNFKGIKHQVIEFDGKSAWLIGGNGQGKSSVIDAMLSAVDTEYIPASPIHEGEQRGSIKIKIAGIRNGQPDEYTIDLTFSPSKRTGTMKVKNKDGFDMGGSGKTIIKDIQSLLKNPGAGEGGNGMAYIAVRNDIEKNTDSQRKVKLHVMGWFGRGKHQNRGVLHEEPGFAIYQVGPYDKVTVS